MQVLPRLILPISTPSSSSTTNAEHVAIIEQDECIDADTPLCEDTTITSSLSPTLLVADTSSNSQTTTTIIDQHHTTRANNTTTTANEVVPVPSLYELVLDQPQPSATWPSDHLMIIANLRLI